MDVGENFEFVKERWFWISAAVLAALVVGLTVAYYVKHPDRNLFEDFARRPPVDLPSTNGHVPGEAAPSGADIAGSQEAS